MSPSCHVALAWLALNDVDDGAEEVRFAVQAAEVLQSLGLAQRVQILVDSKRSYRANDVVVVGEVCLAVLAAVDHGGQVVRRKERIAGFRGE